MKDLKFTLKFVPNCNIDIRDNVSTRVDYILLSECKLYWIEIKPNGGFYVPMGDMNPNDRFCHTDSIKKAIGLICKFIKNESRTNN